MPAPIFHGVNRLEASTVTAALRVVDETVKACRAMLAAQVAYCAGTRDADLPARLERLAAHAQECAQQLRTYEAAQVVLVEALESELATITAASERLWAMVAGKTP